MGMHNTISTSSVSVGFKINYQNDIPADMTVTGRRDGASILPTQHKDVCDVEVFKSAQNR